jgi:molybdate/tungstate transport system substrate-binding protein
MADHQTKFRVRIAAVAGLAALAAAAAGCSSSPASNGGTSAGATAKASAKAPASAKPTGNVNVAYASSLQYLNEKIVSPAFTAAEGYKFVGHGGASTELANDITGGELSPDVFQSVGGDNIKLIEPKFTSWYVQYAGTSIVLAYNPKSKYAADFKAVADGSKNVCTLFSSTLQSPGFKLGRTDPNIDPQGRDFIMMVMLAQSYCHLPSDTAAKILGTSDFGTASSPQIYAEASLDSTLQSGQLDASSAFITQAVELKLPYVKLPDQINLGSASEKAAYAKATVTVKSGKTYKGSPQVIDITTVGSKPSAGAIAFVKYTLSPAGLAQYKQGGFTVLTPTVTGDKSAVPAAIQSELGS